MATEPASVHVSNNENASRYELTLDDKVIGFASYYDADGSLTFPHFEVDPEHRGGGMAGTLARFALDDARAKNRTVVPICPYLVQYMRRHKSDLDLLPEGMTLER